MWNQGSEKENKVKYEDLFIVTGSNRSLDDSAQVAEGVEHNKRIDQIDRSCRPNPYENAGNCAKDANAGRKKLYTHDNIVDLFRAT